MAILAHQMLLLSAIICFYCCQLAPRIWTTHCHFWIFTFSAECNKDLLAVFFINTQYQSQSLVVHFRSREISHICTWCWHFKILPCTSSSSARWWDLGGNSEARCVWWENDRPSPAPVRPGLRTRRLGVDCEVHTGTGVVDCSTSNEKPRTESSLATWARSVCYNRPWVGRDSHICPKLGSQTLDIATPKHISVWICLFCPTRVTPSSILPLRAWIYALPSNCRVLKQKEICLKLLSAFKHWDLWFLELNWIESWFLSFAWASPCLLVSSPGRKL